MLLITVNEWIGVKVNNFGKCDSVEKKVSFYSRLGLNEALIRIHRYQRAYNEYYSASTLNFTLLFVSEVDDVNDIVAGNVGIENLDIMPQEKNDFDEL